MGTFPALSDAKTRAERKRRQAQLIAMVLRLRQVEQPDFVRRAAELTRVQCPAVHKWRRGISLCGEDKLPGLLRALDLTPAQWTLSAEDLARALDFASTSIVDEICEGFRLSGLFDAARSSRYHNRLMKFANDYVAIRPSFSPSRGVVLSEMSVTASNRVYLFRHCEPTQEYKGSVFCVVGGNIIMIGSHKNETDAIYILRKEENANNESTNNGNSDDIYSGIMVGDAKDRHHHLASTKIVLLPRSLFTGDSPKWPDLVSLSGEDNDKGPRQALPKFVDLFILPNEVLALLFNVVPQVVMGSLTAFNPEL